MISHKHIKTNTSFAVIFKNTVTAISICTTQCACFTPDFVGLGSQTYADSALSQKSLTQRSETHESGQVPNEILKFIPQGSDVRLARHGDIDNDGDEDVLVVLQKPGDEHRFEQRTLLVLQRNSLGDLVKRTEGSKAISCISCGGMFGDPLQGIETSKNGFSLLFEGGSRYMWSIKYRFDHKEVTNEWFLVEIRDGALDRLGGDSKSRQLNRSDFGSVSLDQFDTKEFLSHAFP